MIVAIHQPHFLPWQGYLDRMAKADLFIWLDHVQFERQNYQNRVMIKTGEGPRWIIVPVYHASQQQSLVEKIIDNHNQGNLRWGRKVYLTIQYAYQGAPYFSRYAPALKEILDARWEKLVDLNWRLIEFLRDALNIRTPIVRSSELKITGQKNDLVLGLCQAVGADTFLGGIGASKEYIDRDAFAKAGINVTWQDFVHPRYKQHPRPDTFVNGVSAIDLLFNCGPESGSILRGKETAYAEKV